MQWWKTTSLSWCRNQIHINQDIGLYLAICFIVSTRLCNSLNFDHDFHFWVKRSPNWYRVWTIYLNFSLYSSSNRFSEKDAHGQFSPSPKAFNNHYTWIHICTVLFCIWKFCVWVQSVFWREILNICIIKNNHY